MRALSSAQAGIVGAGLLSLALIAGCAVPRGFDTTPDIVERVWVLPRDTKESEFWLFLPGAFLPGRILSSVNEGAGRAETDWWILESCPVGGAGGPSGPCKRAKARIRLERSEPRRAYVAVLQQEAFAAPVRGREVVQWRDSGFSPVLADEIVALLGKNK